MAGKERQRQLARKHYEEQLRRRAEAQTRARRRNTVIGAVIGVAVVVGAVTLVVAYTGGGQADPDPAAAEATPTQEASKDPAAAKGECEYIAEDGPGTKKMGLPPAKPDTSAKKATLVTNHGDITIELETKKAPCAVNSIAFLAGKDFYDDTVCHRLGTGDNGAPPMLQCGDPSAKADGSGGSGGAGYRFAEENLEGASPYARGTVAMAKTAQPDSTGSQFFLVFEETPLDGPKYTPIGKITKGLDIIDKIAKAGTQDGGSGQAPKKKVVIKDVKIAK